MCHSSKSVLTTKKLVEVANYSFSSRLLKWREKRYVPRVVILEGNCAEILSRPCVILEGTE